VVLVRLFAGVHDSVVDVLGVIVCERGRDAQRQCHTDSQSERSGFLGDHDDRAPLSTDPAGRIGRFGPDSLIQTEHDDERQNQPESRKNPA
jgi:hypothetical protein